MEEMSPDRVRELYGRMKEELGKVVMGQEEVLDNLLICLLAGGHLLLEGVPGLAKSLIVSTLSLIMEGDFKRIQFTPDLMPTDIVGTTVYNGDTGEFKVKKGPVFTNLLLADEINRSPAKTQSALLQAMQERAVTIGDTTYSLGDFFICIATQNPVEMEGTYPLPEAQVDRFLMKVLIGYPGRKEEVRMLENYRRGFQPEKPGASGVCRVLSPGELDGIKGCLGKIIVEDDILHYITRLVESTRNFNGIAAGASPRGSVALFQTSRVNALIKGRDFVTPDDVKEMALPVLRHRIMLEPEAEIEGVSPDMLLEQVIGKVEVPR